MDINFEYKPPHEISKEMNAMIRDIKKKNIDEREKTKLKYQHLNAKASPEKIAALTFMEMSPKIMYQLKVDQMKNTDYYHDSEEMARQLSLTKHQEAIESKHKKIDDIIEKKKQKDKDKYQNFIYYKKLIKSIEEKDKDNVGKPFITSPYNHNHRSSAYNSVRENKQKHDTYNDGYFSKIFGSKLSLSNSKPWIMKESYHSGKWMKVPLQVNANAKNQNLDDSAIEEAWSCCFNHDPSSEGCMSRIINKMKWVYD